MVQYGVGGLTHTNNEIKDTISGVLRLDEIADDLELDVTVVITNQNQESIYYYSSYKIGFREENNILHQAFNSRFLKTRLSMVDESAEHGFRIYKAT